MFSHFHSATSIPVAKYFSVGVDKGVDKEGVYFENRKT
jgi:hypothetical protein